MTPRSRRGIPEAQALEEGTTFTTVLRLLKLASPSIFENESSVGSVMSIKNMINQGGRGTGSNTRRPARLRSSEDGVRPSEKEDPAPANRRETHLFRGPIPKKAYD